MKHVHTMPFGALPRARGGVDFRLWAPAASAPSLIWWDADGATHRQRARADGSGEGFWHCRVARAGPGTAYQWEMDGGLCVPDPASRWNPQGPLGPSVVADPSAFDWDEGWTGRPWHEAVLYELHVGSFTPEGTFEAAAAQFERLAALGVTAVELMPVAAFGGRFGWGYDGVLPYAPHAAYGTPDQLKALVQAAHRHGLMVLLDVVYNHFGPQGNFLGQYAPAFFSSTHQSPWGAALNFDGPDSANVRRFFIHNALYWLQEFRFDGLRLDAVHAIADASSPDILQDLSAQVREATAGRHVHLVLENEKNERHRIADAPRPGRFDAQWNDDFHHALHVLLTGETHGYYGDYAAQPLDLLSRALTHGFVFKESARREGGRRVACLPAPPQPLPAMVNAMHNHDQIGNRAFGERLDHLVAPPALELALLLSVLTPATPLLFQGDELATPRPFLYFADWDGELREAVRAGRRREFGHAESPGHPLPDPCAVDSFERSRLAWDAAARRAGAARERLLQSALAARRRWIVPRQPQLASGLHSARRVGASGLRLRWRYTDGAELVLDINLGAAPVEDPVPAPDGAWQPVFDHAWPDPAHAGDAWPAWAARWRLREPARKVVQ
ncbi:MAG: malto-oligosyltrehalose trehalohydrolase [Hydrogenophaga sp.]|uniref:malto-oligosyltrehalose trehalohydrolase n=1 Tax=Hydrogenophaga sp. TaxID=1904254 RepID=UPI001693B889|nr:malto-oligosyltrehalose trehalohydrolase [Hydrogenophaga sp.]NIM42676.1 malto-oligosyltrehalose trehalohydrolase [Hydrogenophaga sp.]NIN25719.1 malto-oligosyltrehalose trehalohydrolase [Hydrogenophaga sp.]NIN30381.1 malto-oligosyltrehalose trehalohydrolase [Hydrogenophaga sp.]NIN56721.1 malto-oligosyltrehalose trehalohydrolase [Hydrogenophaga sp.]NIO53296.1 malto-oligosyltrehalose trehalohydrolase [Hydrogenophaga sp.]